MGGDGGLNPSKETPMPGNHQDERRGGEVETGTNDLI